MTIVQVPVKKVKGATVSVDTDKLPQAVYEYAIVIGLKELASRGMSKLKKEDYGTDGAFNAAVMEIAEKQVEGMYEGKTRIVGAKSKGAGKGPEHTEAMRLARLRVKEVIKASGGKISHYSASDITKGAKAYIEADPDTWYAAARESLSKAPKPTPGIDLAAMGLTEDPKKVKAAEEKKEKAKAAAAAKKAKETTAAGVVAAKKGGTKGRNPAHGVNH